MHPFGDGRFWVQLCIETRYKRATSVAHLTNFSFEFFMQFSHTMPSTFSIPWCKKSRMTRNSIQGGPPLIFPIIALRSGASACLGKASVTQTENQWPRFVSTQCDVVCSCCSEHPSSSTLWIVRRAPLTTMALLGKKTSFLCIPMMTFSTNENAPSQGVAETGAQSWIRPSPEDDLRWVRPPPEDEAPPPYDTLYPVPPLPELGEPVVRDPVPDPHAQHRGGMRMRQSGTGLPQRPARWVPLTAVFPCSF